MSQTLVTSEEMGLKVFVARFAGACTGAISVVIAENENEAKRLVTVDLERLWKSLGKPPRSEKIELEEMDLTQPNSQMVYDGDD